jgi:hypothetical protein
MIYSKGRGRKWPRPVLIYISRKSGRDVKTIAVRPFKAGIRTTRIQARSCGRKYELLASKTVITNVIC